MTSHQEQTPLLGSATGASSYNAGEIEPLPNGASVDQFQPKQVRSQQKRHYSSMSSIRSERSTSGFWASLFGKSNKQHSHTMTMIKPRSAPIKVEPKVFFANERTFLAWMHIAIILAGTSIALLAFGNESDETTKVGSQWYGMVTMPVAIAFIVYAMYQYVRRAYMIRNKHPGPYDDTVGPTILAIMLMISIVCQFTMKLYAISH